MASALSTATVVAAPGAALALLGAAQFMMVVDASIGTVALPSIGRDLRLEAESLAWVVNAYTLVYGGLRLLGGRQADLFGGRRVLLAGLGCSGRLRWQADSLRPSGS